MKKIFLSCAICCMCPSFALAQAISDSLPFSAEPDRQWIAALNGGDLTLRRADVVKSPEELHLSAVFADLPEDVFVAGIVQYQGGMVKSAPMHRPGEQHLPRESTKVAQRRIAEAATQISLLQKKKAALQEEATRLRHSLRHEAGLDEVDRLYDRVSELEARLGELGIKVDDNSSLQ
ncbi:MAG: hypothetical protein K1X79_03850 [Oligoflexia bacterium]|nr:hypothetical protein [Oligoflexia bacterium]